MSQCGGRTMHASTSRPVDIFHYPGDGIWKFLILSSDAGPAYCQVGAIDFDTVFVANQLRNCSG
jgi:hypothetical protein